MILLGPDSCTDPYRNLAFEEAMLSVPVTDTLLRLWRNSPSVIVGRHQNAHAEVDAEWMRSHNIPLVRRLSGGGAVFHDLGNINFSFVGERLGKEDTQEVFRRFTAPMLKALASMGIKASLSGRNDLLLPDGRKFSGNAMTFRGTRVLMHGTLLFSSALEHLAACLKPRPEKFEGKAVKSVRSRVALLGELLPSMNADSFLDSLCAHFRAQGAEDAGADLTERINAETEVLLKEKYSLESWNWGESPRFTVRQTVRRPDGLWEYYLVVEKGIITQAAIMGDMLVGEPEKVAAELVGKPYSSISI
ncbi:MAG: lipoate--protein ligase [Bacteroidales bacterium]|nr:lipoate--protein ligase [Bacteroidales bacterium]